MITGLYYYDFSIDRGVIVNLTGTTRDSTSVVLSWTAPPCPNGRITGYIVYYRTTNYSQSSPISSSGYSSSIKISSDLSISEVIDNLISSETYAFHVRAFFNESEPGLVSQELLLELNSQVTLDEADIQAVLNQISTSSRELTIGLPSLEALASAGITNVQ